MGYTETRPIDAKLETHVEEHGCGTGDINDPRYVGGFLHCQIAKTLWDALPEDKQILFGGAP
jgi:hypothetical protein